MTMSKPDMGKRVLFDSNLYIRFLLLPPDKVTTISELFDHVFFCELTLVVPLAIVDEIAGRVLTKPYLAERIRGSDVERLIGNAPSHVGHHPDS